jgi:hypothetical protein
MKPSYIIVSFTILLSISAQSEVEYYHCEESVDTFWKFDINAINNKSISPHKSPKVRVRQLGFVDEISDVEISSEWFKVTSFAGGGLFQPDIEIETYINRKGGHSIRQVVNPIFGDGKSDMGVCKDFIEGENLDILFKMQSELQQEVSDLEGEKLGSLPPPKNWN